MTARELRAFLAALPQDKPLIVEQATDGLYCVLEAVPGNPILACVQEPSYE